MNDKIISKYLKTATKSCPSAFRKRLKVDLYNSLCSYAEENLELTEAELIAAFGEPSAYSAEYVAAFSDDEKLKMVKKNRLVRWLIASLLGIIALTGIVIAAATIYDAFNTEYYYFEQKITDEGTFPKGEEIVLDDEIWLE